MSFNFLILENFFVVPHYTTFKVKLSSIDDEMKITYLYCIVRSEHKDVTEKWLVNAYKFIDGYKLVELEAVSYEDYKNMRMK